jgi:hypothetical protein
VSEHRAGWGSLLDEVRELANDPDLEAGQLAVKGATSRSAT